MFLYFHESIRDKHPKKTITMDGIAKTRWMHPPWDENPIITHKWLNVSGDYRDSVYRENLK
jgi:hypothetical protein